MSPALAPSRKHKWLLELFKLFSYYEVTLIGRNTGLVRPSAHTSS